MFYRSHLYFTVRLPPPEPFEDMLPTSWHFFPIHFRMYLPWTLSYTTTISTFKIINHFVISPDSHYELKFPQLSQPCLIVLCLFVLNPGLNLGSCITFGYYITLVSFNVEQLYDFLFFPDEVQASCLIEWNALWICLIVSSWCHWTCFSIPHISHELEIRHIWLEFFIGDVLLHLPSPVVWGGN